MSTNNNSFIFFLLIFLIFFININNCPSEQSQKDAIKEDRIDSLNQVNKNEKENTNKKRILTDSDCDGFQRLKIYIDLSDYNLNYPPGDLLEYNETFIEAIEIAKSTLEKIICIDVDLTVNNIHYGVSKREEWGIDAWNTEIFETILDFSIYNYYILFRFNNSINEVTSSDILDENEVPFIGRITINPDKILEKQITKRYLTNLMLQKFIQLLGFQIDTDSFSHEKIQEEEEEENGDFYYIYYISKNDDDEYSLSLFDYINKYYGCEKIDNVTFELDKDNNIYWPSRQFLGDIMTNIDYPEEKVISGLTIAFLEYLEYIKVDKKYTGGLMKFGKKKGCRFFYGDCGRNLEEEVDEPTTVDIPEEYKTNINKRLIFGNEFYLPKEVTPSPQPSCSSGRLSKTIYNINLITSSDIDAYHEYILDDNYVGRKETNYCPIAEFNTDTLSNSLSTGSCYDTPENYVNSLGEEFGEESFCILRSLNDNNGNNIDNIRAACYKMFCSLKSLTIKIGNDYIVCPRSGGKIKPENFNYYILCPDYYLICSGNNLCNNIFNCIDKVSEEKLDSFKYDYEIKTTQNSSIYLTDPIIIDSAWELSSDGKCPQFCMKCGLDLKCTTCAPHYIYNSEGNECLPIVPNCKDYNDEDVCLSCIEDYALIIENNNTRVCIDDTTIDGHYYSETDNGITYYRRCHYSIPDCELCNSKTVCSHCYNNYIEIDNGEKCVDINSKLYYLDTNDGNKNKSCGKYEGNPKCEECEINEGNYICLKCSEGYAFFFDEPDVNKCIDKSTKNLNLNKYFTEDNINYYPCNNMNYHLINNCNTCNKKDECISCIGEFISVNDNKLCILLSDKLYYKDSDDYYYLCSNNIEHCHKCESKNKCIECDSNYYVEEASGKCISKQLVEDNEFFLDNDKAINCSIISNCMKCTSATECTFCINDFYFVEDDNKIICQNININSYYEKTEGGKTFYRKCDKDIEKCFSCSGSNFCNECQNGFAIIEDNHTICQDLSTEKFYKETTSGNYKLCSNKISYCEKCTPEETNFICKECISDYVLKHENDDNNYECVEKSTIINDKHYYTDDNGKNYYSCNAFSKVNNCLLCEEKDTCLECQEKYSLVNQSTSCVLTQDIQNRLLFHDTILDIYIFCKDLISECNKCIDRTNCTECYESSVLEQNNSCINKTLIEDHYYILDEESKKYISCSIIDNCKTCTSLTVCAECDERYRVNNGKCEVISSSSDDNKKLKTGAIIGIVFGCVGFLLIVAGVVLFLIKKFKKNNETINKEKIDLEKIEEKQDEMDDKDIVNIYSKKRNIHNNNVLKLSDK